VPNVLAVDARRRCLLMTPLAGVDTSTGAVLPAAAATIARLQVGCIGDVGTLLTRGAPRRGLAETRTRFLDVANIGQELAELAPKERAGLQAALPWLLDQVAELEAIGIPDTLCHGDLHLGNIAYAAGRARIFDWSDACVGHPFLDLAHLVVRLPEVQGPVDPDWYEPYLAAWRGGWPDAVLRRAIDLAVVVERMFQAVTLEELGAWVRKVHAADRCARQLAAGRHRRSRAMLPVGTSLTAPWRLRCLARGLRGRPLRWWRGLPGR
jgi:hypothetical protein